MSEFVFEKKSSVLDGKGNLVERWETEDKIQLRIKRREESERTVEQIEKWYWKYVGINKEEKTIVDTKIIVN